MSGGYSRVSSATNGVVSNLLRAPTDRRRDRVRGDLLSLADGHNSLLRHAEAPPILYRVDPDVSARRDQHVLVHDCASNHSPSADLDAAHQHTVLDERPAVDADVWREDRAARGPARDDHARADERVQGMTSPPLVIEDELGRRRIG